jgi:hypothetical protein
MQIFPESWFTGNLLKFKDSILFIQFADENKINLLC